MSRLASRAASAIAGGIVPALASRSPSREESPAALGELSQLKKRQASVCPLLAASTPYSQRYISVVCFPAPWGTGATATSSKKSPLAFLSDACHQLAKTIIAVLSCAKVLVAPVSAAPLRIRSIWYWSASTARGWSKETL